jgi:hypothetical protein
VLASTLPWFVRIGVVEPHEVNGQPGAIFRDRDGKVLSTLASSRADPARQPSRPRETMDTQRKKTIMSDLSGRATIVVGGANVDVSRS